METNMNDSVQNEQSGTISTGSNQAVSASNTMESGNADVSHVAQNKEFEQVLSISADAEDDVENLDPDNLEAHHETNGFDYSGLSKHELVEMLSKIVHNQSIESIRGEVDVIKSNFYKKLKSETEASRKQFVEAGGNIEDFKAEEDTDEIAIKELLKHYRDSKAELNKRLEAEKEENLKIKLDIIEKIKELVNGTESLNDTFSHFSELQKKWRLTGVVPQQKVNDLWENYNLQVERFYDYVKINKELRDLDLKKNLEAKLQLCEQAESLILEPSVVNAFKKLQDLHHKWRETGPAPRENRVELWNRFREATAQVNKQHQDYFEGLKKSQKANLDQKTVLCEKAEEILQSELTSFREWEDKSKELLDLQNVWRTIGFAPKKDNNKIYFRFRTACDEFFRRKREFFSRSKDEQTTNLQLKTDLCVQAESISESTEWKKATEELLNIQKKWKEIGPVPRKYSDLIWKRFRAACDKFFHNKSTYYAQLDNQYEENLTKKLALIEEIESFQLVEEVEQNFASLKDFQRRWTEIGFIPLKKKEEIQARYKKSLDKLYDSLRMDESKRKMVRFKSKVEEMSHNPRKGNIDQQREKLVSHYKKLESDIAVWENNIGFFAHSKNAEALIRDVESKIAEARNEIKLLEEKINLIDKIE
jgi:hypothetical protein